MFMIQQLISEYIPKRTKSRDSNRYLSTNIMAALFTTEKKDANNPNEQSKYPPTNEWINRMIYVYNKVLFSLKR